MRYLGIDLGTKTLGLSITDRTNTLVTPLKVIRFPFEDYNYATEEVIKIAKEYDIKTIVLGFPKNMDGSIGFAGERSLHFQKLLEEHNLHVELVDERLTTKSAEQIIHAQEKNVKNTKDKIDSVAASIILESYLKRCKDVIEK